MSDSKVIVKDHGWRAFFANVKAIKDAGHVKVGVLADTEEGGLHEEGGELTVAEIAAVLEFGTEDGSIPARPVLRPSFDAERERLIKLSEHMMGLIIDGKMKPEQALGVLGNELVMACRRRIQAGVPPPNAPSTALAKAKTGKTKGLFKRAADTLGRGLAQVGALAAVKPWIDTGRTLAAFTYVVVGKGQK